MNFWRSISDIGTRSTDEMELTKRIQLVNQLSFVAVGASVLFIPILYLLGNTHFSKILLVISIVSIAYAYFSYRRMINVALIWTLLLTLISTSWGSIENPNAGVEFLLIPLSLVPFTVVRRINICYSFVLLTAICFSATYFVGKGYVPHSPISGVNAQIMYLAISLTSFALSAFIISQFRLVNSKYEHIIKKQKLEVEAKNKDIIDSIKYAKRIQDTLLPQEKFIEKTLARLLQGSGKP